MLEVERGENKISTIDVAEGKPPTSVMSKFGFVFSILFLFLFTPSPIYMCFDGCLGRSVVIPFVLVATSLFTLFSLFNPIIWILHFIFIIPFAASFVIVNKLFKQAGWKWWLVRLIVKIVVFIVLWICIAKLWNLIPVATTQSWFGQRG